MIVALVCLSLIAVAIVLVLREVFLGYGPPIVEGHRALGAKEQAVVAAAADAMFPEGGPIPLSGTQAGLVRYMDRHVADLSSRQRALVKLLLWFVEHGPRVFGPSRRARFTRLSHDERARALASMRTSSVYFRRIAFLSLRAMLTMGYLANADVARHMRMTASASPFDPRAAGPSVA